MKPVKAQWNPMQLNFSYSDAQGVCLPLLPESLHRDHSFLRMSKASLNRLGISICHMVFTFPQGLIAAFLSWKQVEQAVPESEL